MTTGEALMRTIATLGIWLVVGIAAAADRPNILWISAEDISPDLGCYGDPYALTPHLDRFAKESIRYTRCFTHAGVCAPSRSGLITGMYPPGIGTQHMRCRGVPPDVVRCFPEYLRAAGYYCTNNVKTDYQFDAPASAWDMNSNKADWTGRAPEQPFFSVINFTTTHESQIRDPSPQTQRLVAALSSEQRHDPDQAIVPPFYPDTPVIRRDLANYADNLTALDRQVAEVLDRLERDGLADDTIVWFWGDHGRGLPRYKRWLYDTGTRVPLLIRIPPKWRDWALGAGQLQVVPGSVREDLVAFVDFAPTILSLAGVPIPDHFQGQAFLGPDRSSEPRQYVYGHRDRMDETYDLIRMVRDRRFKYLRNFLWDRSYAQTIAYMEQMPTMREWRRLHVAGELSPAAELFFRERKPVEELYDTEADPHELHNLAGDPAHADVLLRLRAECQRWMLLINDTGLIPEAIFDEWQRPGDRYAQAAPPKIVVGDRAGDEVAVSLTPVTAGSSVVYAITPSQSSLPKNPPWKLATSALRAKVGEVWHFKACRLGYRDSEVVAWKVGDPLPPVPTVDESVAAEVTWPARLGDGVLLPALLQLKSFDGRMDPGALETFAALQKHPEPAVRYWAVRSWMLQTPDEPAAIEQRLTQIWQDETSPTVRMLAAEGLARHGHDAALAYLADQLRSHPQANGRLQAAQALRQLGERARPVLPQIEAAVMDGEYVGRVTRDLLSQLGQPHQKKDGD